MNAPSQPDKAAQIVAEEILRTIYGDDFKGCTVTLDSIATIIEAGFKRQQGQARELLELYEKLVEALDLLSTPPDGGKVTDPNELRTLLSQRLDAIHALTTKTIATTARVNKGESV